MDGLEKNVLRQKMRKILRSFTPADRMRAGEEITYHVAQWLVKQKSPQKIGLFVSMADEISTGALIDFLKIKAVCALPFIDEDDELSFFSAIDIDHYDPGLLARPPKNKTLIKTSDLTAIFMPGLAFDRLGHRLGRGRGYYDRTLKHVKNVKPPLLVGLALDEQILPNVPVEPHDIMVDYLCTPGLGMHLVK